MMKSQSLSAEPQNPRAIAARNRNRSPCIPCQEKRQGCSRDSPCLRCLQKGTPELCVRRIRGASGSSPDEIRIVQETGQRTKLHKHEYTSPGASSTWEDGSSVPSSLSPTEMDMGRHEELDGLRTVPEGSLPSDSHAFFGSPMCMSPTDFTNYNDNGQTFQNGEISFHEGEQIHSHSADYGASVFPSEPNLSQVYDQDMLSAHDLLLNQNLMEDLSMEHPFNHGGLPNSASSLPAPLQTSVDVNDLLRWFNMDIRLQDIEEILAYVENMPIEDTSAILIQGNIPDLEYADEVWAWLSTPVEENYQSGRREEVLQAPLYHQNYVQREDTPAVYPQTMWNSSNPGTDTADHGRSDTSLRLPAEIQTNQTYENGTLLLPSEMLLSDMFKQNGHPLDAAYHEHGSSASSNGIIGREGGQTPSWSPLPRAGRYHVDESREPPGHVFRHSTESALSDAIPRDESDNDISSGFLGLS